VAEVIDITIVEYYQVFKGSPWPDWVWGKQPGEGKPTLAKCSTTTRLQPSLRLHVFLVRLYLFYNCRRESHRLCTSNLL